MNRSPLVLALTAGLALAACKTTDDPNAFDTSTADGPGINVTSAEKHFGLDYSFDPESGQMTREDSHAFNKSAYNPGASTFKTSSYVNRLNTYEAGKFKTGKTLDAGEADQGGTFKTFTSRLAGRSSREAGNTYDTSADPLARSSRAYATSPFRRSAERMGTGNYRPAADAQSGVTRPASSITRKQRTGDPGVVINRPDGNLPTVEDIADLMKNP